jgi:ubiquinone/menaquinone biosynthesis C-methylase UbiE/uncharacterized protein YbaR (Trm112 family)
LQFPEEFKSQAKTDSERSDLAQAAERYARFGSQTQQLIKNEKLQKAAVHFLYAILPALYRTASESYGGEKRDARDQEIENIVKDFMDGYEDSPLAFYLITIVIKSLEKTLFNRIQHRGPSLDLGIGDGYSSNFILKPNKITVGSEPSLGALLTAKKYQRHEHYMGVDMTCIPFADETFNTVYLIHSIDHVEDRLSVLREVERVMKPGGVVALSDASQYIEELLPMSEIYKLFEFKELGSDAFKYFLDYGGERVEFYSPEVYHRILDEMGFEDIQVEYFMAPQLAKMCYAQFELQLVMGGHEELMKAPENRKVREFFFDCVKRTIVPLLSADKELCQREGKGLNMFVTARKKGGASANGGAGTAGNEIISSLTCPECKGRLVKGKEDCSCQSCGLNYPVVDSIPLLVPFYAEGYAKLKEISPNLHSMKRKVRKGDLIKKQLKRVPYFHHLIRLMRETGLRG